MALESMALPSELENGAGRGPLTAAKIIGGYWALTKPDVNALVAVTAGIAFCLGSTRSASHFPTAPLLNILLGTFLIAGGSGALNQYIERGFDARMRRTSRRPLAAGILEPGAALCFALSLSVAGALYLAMTANVFAASLAVVASVLYLFVYTPLKRVTPLCTLVGAIPGAMPPLIGWAAATGGLSLEAWVLYSFLFLWQFPHFMAIAWMYREDYVRAGYRILPSGSGRTPFVILQTLLPLLACIPVSTVPMFLGYTSRIYGAEAILLSSLFFCCGLRLAVMRTNCAARRLLVASIAYLPTVFALLMLENK